MKLYKKMITGTVLLAGLAGLFGCGGNNSSNNTTPAAPKPKNFASIPMYAEGGMGMTCGDFDGDGDLDLVVGGSASASGLSTAGKIYFVKNENGTFSKPEHFASIPMYAEGGMGMTCGDFDGDGDLDLVVGGSASASGLSTAGKIYQFNNDGKGNFSQEGGNY